MLWTRQWITCRNHGTFLWTDRGGRIERPHPSGTTSNPLWTRGDDSGTDIVTLTCEDGRYSTIHSTYYCYYLTRRTTCRK